MILKALDKAALTPVCALAVLLLTLAKALTVLPQLVEVVWTCCARPNLAGYYHWRVLVRW